MKLARTAVAALALPVALTAPAPVEAQSLVTATFGETATPDAGPVEAAGRMLTLGYAQLGDQFAGALTAGLPPDASSGTRWAAADLWAGTDEVVGPVGFAGLLTAFAYHDPVLETSGGGLESRVRATTTARLGPARLEFRAGARAGLLSTSAGRLRALHPEAGSELRLPAGPAQITGALDLHATGGTLYPGVRGGAELESDRLRVAGTVSRWLHDDLPGTGWSLSAALRLTDRVEAVAQATQTRTDPLFWTEPRRHWAVGLRAAVGGGRRGALPAAVVPAGERVRFRVDGSLVTGPVGLAGGFSGWDPIPMERREGHWILDLRLEPGIHEFSFVDQHGTWFTPEGTPGRKPDGYGGHVGTVVVR